MGPPMGPPCDKPGSVNPKEGIWGTPKGSESFRGLLGSREAGQVFMSWAFRQTKKQGLEKTLTKYTTWCSSMFFRVFIFGFTLNFGCFEMILLFYCNSLSLRSPRIRSQSSLGQPWSNSLDIFDAAFSNSLCKSQLNQLGWTSRTSKHFKHTKLGIETWCYWPHLPTWLLLETLTNTLIKALRMDSLNSPQWPKWKSPARFWLGLGLNSETKESIRVDCCWLSFQRFFWHIFPSCRGPRIRAIRSLFDPGGRRRGDLTFFGTTGRTSK